MTRFDITPSTIVGVQSGYCDDTALAMKNAFRTGNDVTCTNGLNQISDTGSSMKS